MWFAPLRTARSIRDTEWLTVHGIVLWHRLVGKVKREGRCHERWHWPVGHINWLLILLVLPTWLHSKFCPTEV